MKLIKVFLILCAILAISSRKIKKAKRTNDAMKPTGKCVEYCEFLVKDLNLADKLDKEKPFVLRGCVDEKWSCSTLYNGKESDLVRLKNANIVVVKKGDNPGNWECKLA